VSGGLSFLQNSKINQVKLERPLGNCISKGSECLRK
jgi:hypothetical protein